MGFRTLGAILATLCVMTSTLVSARALATNTSDTAVAGTSSGETVAQLLADVQTAVANNPALAHMFDVPNASELSDEELTTRLHDLLDATLRTDSSSSNATSNEVVGDATSASTEGSVPSCATSYPVAVVWSVLLWGALGAIL